jgi:hypothetical protein
MVNGLAMNIDYPAYGHANTIWQHWKASGNFKEMMYCKFVNPNKGI